MLACPSLHDTQSVASLASSALTLQTGCALIEMSDSTLDTEMHCFVPQSFLVLGRTVCRSSEVRIKVYRIDDQKPCRKRDR